MTAPIDYASMVGDPFANVAKGYQFGANLVNIENQRLAQQQIAAERNRFFSNPNPTMRDAMQFASLLPVDQANALRPYIENYSKEQQQNVLKFNGQVLSAMQTNPAHAIKLLRTKETAERNAGDTEEADLFGRIATAMEDPNQGPAVGFKSLASITAALPGAKEMFANYSSISAQQTDEALGQIMAGANTVDQVFERIPLLAQMGEKGLEFANKMLTQQRLREKQLFEGMDLSKQQQDEAKESRQAAAVLKAVFGPDAFTVGEQVKTTSQAAGTEQPPVAEAEGEVGTIAQKERPIMVATAGSLEGLLALRPTKKFIEAVGKGEVQITPEQRGMLGLDETTTATIKAIASVDPETAAGMIMKALELKIKAQTAAQKPQQLTATEREVIAAGFPQGTPEHVAAMREKLKLGPGAITRIEDRIKAEGDFRKEYNQQTTVYRDVKAAYGRVLASEDTAVGDLSLIFGYMKMLDPGSVVREGEFATAQNAAGVPERIQNIYNRVMSGERLSPSQRSSFKGQAGKLYSTAKVQESSVRNGLSRIAKGYGLNPANIFYDVSGDAAPAAPVAPASQPAAQPAAPAAGVSVTLPTGKTMIFPNQQAADAFKKAAGMK